MDIPIAQFVDNLMRTGCYDSVQLEIASQQQDQQQQDQDQPKQQQQQQRQQQDILNVKLCEKNWYSLYIGGGIVPKIWNDNYQEMFLKYFFGVGRLKPLLRCVDVTIILNPMSVLFGAVHYAYNQDARND